MPHQIEKTQGRQHPLSPQRNFVCVGLYALTASTGEELDEFGCPHEEPCECMNLLDGVLYGLNRAIIKFPPDERLVCAMRNSIIFDESITVRQRR